MKKLTTKLLAVICGCLVSMSAWAQVVSLETLPTTYANFCTTYTDGSLSVTLTSPEFTSLGSSSGYYYLDLSSTPSSRILTKCLAITSTGTIDSIAFLASGSGNNKSIEVAALGWATACNEAVATADYVATLAYTTPSSGGSGFSTAEWHTFNTETWKAQEVRLYRKVQGIAVGDNAAASYGAGQTVRIWGLKIWAKGLQPSISAFTAADVEATIDQTAKTITAELPYGTDLTSITPVVNLGGTATGYTPAGAQDFSGGAVNYTVTDGTNNVTYAVTLTASTTVSHDATLSDLTINGTTVESFDATTYSYNYTFPYVDAVPTIAAEATDAASTMDVTQATSDNLVATVVVTAQDGTTQLTYTVNFTRADALHELTEVIFSNTFNAFIVGDSVAAFYMAGESVPTIESYKASAGATIAINDNKIVLTAANGVTYDYKLNLAAVTPYQPTAAAITFDGSEDSWIKTGYTYAADKGWRFAKAVEEASNKRISEGKTRLYFFVKPCEKVVFTSGSGGTRNIKVYVNGVELATPTATSAADETFEIALDNANNNMLAIISNQTGGDGGVIAATFTPSALTPTSIASATLSGVSYANGIIYNGNQTALQVYSATGKLVATGSANIDMNGFAAGMYIVRSAEGSMKFVK